MNRDRGFVERNFVITYTVGSGLYVNLTNRCSNSCIFCVRNEFDNVNGNDNLWLEREPSGEEVWAEIEKKGLINFSELVFCGFGEPTIKLDEMLYVCKKVRESEFKNVKIRLNTNGHADLLHQKTVAPILEGFIDIVSISLNAENAEEYNKICKPNFSDGYEGMLKFAAECKKYVKTVVLSVVETTISLEQVEKCRLIAEEMDVIFRIRTII